MNSLSRPLSDAAQHLAAVTFPGQDVLLTAVYLLAAVVCGLASHMLRRQFPYSRVTSASVWLTLGVAALGLGLCRQFHLLTEFTGMVRDLASEQGWYEGFRMYQTPYVTMVVGLSIVGYVLVMMRLMRVGWRPMLAGTALIAFCGFLIVKAASFHNIDVLLSTRIFSLIRIDHLVELSAMLCLSAAAGTELLAHTLGSGFRKLSPVAAHCV